MKAIKRSLLLAMVLLLVTVQSAEIATSGQCCSTCREIKNNQRISGSQVNTFVYKVLSGLKYSSSLVTMVQQLSYLPSHFTVDLWNRVKDINERVSNGLAATQILITDTDTERVPFSQVIPQFPYLVMSGLNATIDDNLLQEDPIYIETKKKTLQRFQDQYDEWLNNPYYLAKPNSEATAKTVAMALIEADFMQLGAVEQADAKQQALLMANSEQCQYHSRACDRNNDNLRYKSQIDSELKGIRLFNISKSDFRRLIYGLRTVNGGVFFNNRTTGYFDERKILMESYDDSFDWGSAVYPVLSIRRSQDVKLLSNDSLDLFMSLPFGSPLEMPQGQTPTFDRAYLLKHTSIWSYISTTYMGPLLYLRYGESLLGALGRTCPLTCSASC